MVSEVRRQSLLLALFPLALLLYPLSWCLSQRVFEGYLAIHVVWFVIVLLLVREPVNRRGILFAAIGVRLLLIAVPPFTTHDVGRYLWDGYVLGQGFDPYLHSPNQLSELASQWSLPFDNREYPSLYPPLALTLFRVSVIFGESAALWVWKGFLCLASLGTVYFLNRSLKNDRKFLWIVLNPVLVLETLVGAHVDAWVALSVAAAYSFWQERRETLSGFCLGIGVLFKLNPLLCFLGTIPLLWKRKQGMGFVWVFLLTVGVGYGVFLGLGYRPLGSLMTFYRSWRFGSPIVAFLGALGMDGWTLPLGLVLLGATGGYLFRRLRAEEDVAMPWMLMLCVFLLASPVVFPWYLLPLIVIPHGMFFVGLWSFALPFTYEVMTQYVGGGAWNPAAWPLWVICLCWVLGGYLLRRWGKVLLE